MHEMSLAIQAIRSVLDFADENGIDAIDTVVLEIGELSLVVPEYMEEAWNAACRSTMLERARLRIDVTPGNGLCQGCGKVYNIVENRGTCPYCGSREKEILCGREFNIQELLVPE